MNATDPNETPKGATLAINGGSSEEEALQPTGAAARVTLSKYYFSTRDLLVIVIVGVIGGCISGLIPFDLLVKTWYPFTGGTQLVSGNQVLWYPLVYGITRKKPSIFITAIIKGLTMFLLGVAQWGILEVAFSLYEGFFVALGFAVVERIVIGGTRTSPEGGSSTAAITMKSTEGETFLGWGIACGLGNVTQVPLFWWITGKFLIIPPLLFIMAVMLAFASGVLMAGVLGKFVVDRLRKAGIA
jgi:hypothetical protein